MLKLKKYQVTGFRSVKDSGWIETDDVTALIGVNESGKTNLILPLWKSNPANEGKIVPLLDYPRVEYTERRQHAKARVFIRAQYATDAALVGELTKLTGLSAESFELVEIARCFDGTNQVTFPSVKLPQTVNGADLEKVLSAAKNDIESDTTDDILKPSLLAAIAAASRLIAGAGGQVGKTQIEGIHQKLSEAPTGDTPCANVT